MRLSTTRVDDGHHINKDRGQPLIPVSLSFPHSLSLPIDLSKGTEDGYLPLEWDVHGHPSCVDGAVGWDRGRSGWHPCFIGIVSIPISCGGQPRLFLSFSSSLSDPIAPSAANGMAMHISFEGVGCHPQLPWIAQLEETENERNSEIEEWVVGMYPCWSDDHHQLLW